MVETKKRSITLIVCDSLRLDSMTEKLMPNLYGYSKKYQRFDYAIAGNSCTEFSLPHMLCGKPDYVPDHSFTRLLEDFGYSTHLYHSNLVVKRFEGAFQHVHDLYQGRSKRTAKIIHFFRTLLGKTGIFDLLRTQARKQTTNYLPYTRAKEVFEYKRKNQTPGLRFEWVHLMDPHSPYFPYPSELSDKEIIHSNDLYTDALHGRKKATREAVRLWKHLYDLEITQMDYHISEYVNSCDLTNEVVIITSDHGEEFMEHNQLGHQPDKHVPVLVHVPMIVIGDKLGASEKPIHHDNLVDLVISLTHFVRQNS